ncbi:hypothetical protein N9073_01865 [Akkermansiaceae bacterium]|nr:hypothetical protein [Akkermansiaceae bacterium]MDA7937186.1 hypothetical protein [bacterium]MDB4455473.1 hypothetical protein [Akkermansiaceae bacterium]MDB4471316.1 hypothetical protein [Akkermansiaceae bacterium]MDB4482357.1 hypothetical protein [Akkermansiaceae bacterium]
MKTRIAIISLIIVAVIGGFVWHYNQPNQRINRTIDQFIGALEYNSSNLRSREDVHKAIQASTVEPITLKVSELPFNLEIPREMSVESLCNRVDRLHAITVRRKFTKREEDLQLMGNKAQLTRIDEITMTTPLRESKSELWELIFDLELTERWKITAIRARRYQ